jgi:RNA polymerase sigma-70 factor (ECF subfamily)
MEGSMAQPAEEPRQALEKFRRYLRVLACMHLDRRLWAKLDPDDVVQSAFAEALEKWHQFQGQGEEQLKGWLRRMLLHNIGDAVRHFHQQKCDVLLEQPLEQSSARILSSLAAEQSSPSERAAKNEQVQRLAEALLQLSKDQQEAVILHHLHERTLADVAEYLGRSLPATAGLIHRGLTKLKRLLEERQ